MKLFSYETNIWRIVIIQQMCDPWISNPAEPKNVALRKVPGYVKMSTRYG